jgi:hypothetical protein
MALPCGMNAMALPCGMNRQNDAVFKLRAECRLCSTTPTTHQWSRTLWSQSLFWVRHGAWRVKLRETFVSAGLILLSFSFGVRNGAPGPHPPQNLSALRCSEKDLQGAQVQIYLISQPNHFHQSVFRTQARLKPNFSYYLHPPTLHLLLGAV